MKNKIFLLTIILLSSFSFSQTKKAVSQIIYLDSLWHNTTEGNHQYYRIVNEYYSDRDFYIINDFYKSGVLQMIGKSKDKDQVRLEGQTIFYYENGNKKSTCNYEAAKKSGKEFAWYESGAIKLEAEHIIAEDKKTNDYRLLQFWDTNSKQTVIDGNGIYENAEDLEANDTSASFSEKGEIKNGKRNGIWTGKSTKFNTTYTESYVNGKFINGTSTLGDYTKHHYTELKQAAAPKNGMQDFYRYIGKQFRTPKIEGLQGKIYMTFEIDKEGNLTNPKVLRDLGYQTGEEAVRVINAAKNWNPARLRGIAISSFYALPITITAR